MNGNINAQRYQQQALQPVNQVFCLFWTFIIAKWCLCTTEPGLTLHWQQGTGWRWTTCRCLVPGRLNHQIWTPLRICGRLRIRPQLPQDEVELYQTVRDEWENLDQDYARRLVLSMRCRCTALHNAAGGHTKYWWCSHVNLMKIKLKS